VGNYRQTAPALGVVLKLYATHLCFLLSCAAAAAAPPTNVDTRPVVQTRAVQQVTRLGENKRKKACGNSQRHCYSPAAVVEGKSKHHRHKHTEPPLRKDCFGGARWCLSAECRRACCMQHGARRQPQQQQQQQQQHLAQQRRRQQQNGMLSAAT